MGLHGMNAKEKTGWVVREYGKSKRKDKESQLNFEEQNGALRVRVGPDDAVV